MPVRAMNSGYWATSEYRSAVNDSAISRHSRIYSGYIGFRGLIQIELDFQCSTFNFDKIPTPYVDFLHGIEYTSDDGTHFEGVEGIDVVRFRWGFWSRDCTIHRACVGHPLPDSVPAREIRLGSKPLGRHKPFGS
jgi:hypothetical protein